MKKLLLSSLIIVIFYSCAIKKINYSYDFKTIAQGLDFTQRQDNWLLNTINLSERNNKVILNQLNKWTKGNTTLTSKMLDKQGKRINNFFSTTIDNENLNFLEKTSNYKYLVNVYIFKNNNSTPRVTVTEMMFDFYDIKTKKIILSERVIGSMDNEKTTNIGDIHGFRVTATPDMINGLIKKGLKRIDKNSKY